jgi:hypothetical protein
MAGLSEFYCRWNETSLGSQFKWLEYTFKDVMYNINEEYIVHIRLEYCASQQLPTEKGITRTLAR